MKRDLAEKGWVHPLLGALVDLLGAAVVVFYVLLTPLWIGLRVAAWIASRRGAAC